MNQIPIDDRALRREIERDMLRSRDCRRRAEEIVRDRGWTEKDEDFEFQIEVEAKAQWSEEMKREMEEEMQREFLREMRAEQAKSE